jgi:hypothetical protein
MHTTPWHRSRNTVNRRAVVYRETSELVDWPDEDASGFYGTVVPPTLSIYVARCSVTALSWPDSLITGDIVPLAWTRTIFTGEIDGRSDTCGIRREIT